MANVSGLTEKMKQFAREYYKNGGNGTEAYLIAYNTDSRTTAQRESSLLLKRADINEYLKALNIPNENKAISEREKKRELIQQRILACIEKEDDTNARGWMDILNKMDSEYININRNITDQNDDIKELDTDNLIKLVTTA